MAWVRRHRRTVPGGLFRSTTVRSHYRRNPGAPIVPILIAAAVIIILLIAIF
ncbi:hypothetical protein [Actinophytocola sp.]|uniref:hypothetical protein n=1 Tax=Actinophytocola sp. TaxID=1872138 RepID=UPI002D8088D2|nr:hypothetical protein [Actinophytocola sp.]HET9138412.1 hypothetical protein [Actinophytocola sp.]